MLWHTADSLGEHNIEEEDQVIFISTLFLPSTFAVLHGTVFAWLHLHWTRHLHWFIYSSLLLPTPLPDYGSKRFHHFCMHPWPEVDQPMRYNSKLMNSIWGRYNEHSVHNFKSLQCGGMQAAALGGASAFTANEAAGPTMMQPPSPTLNGRWASLTFFISCHIILTGPHNKLFLLCFSYHMSMFLFSAAIPISSTTLSLLHTYVCQVLFQEIILR